jgi:hypothetical protein
LARTVEHVGNELKGFNHPEVRQRMAAIVMAPEFQEFAQRYSQRIGRKPSTRAVPNGLVGGFESSQGHRIPLDSCRYSTASRRATAPKTAPYSILKITLRPHSGTRCSGASWTNLVLADGSRNPPMTAVPARTVFHLETVAKLLRLLGHVCADFSKCTLKSLDNQTDFDSAIPRFESWRPSHESSR